MDDKKNRIAIERLTALWALNECGLGGFMHAFSSPFTGIIVGGISILLISLIAFYAKNTWVTLLKALSIVLLVKLSVSPHSPITAYVAVSFQAFFGAIVFSLFTVRPFTILLLGGITFLESAVQKLLVLTVLYGQSLWQALDVYGLWVSDKLAFLPLTISSRLLMLLFVCFYFLSGIVVGFLIIRTISIIKLTDQSSLDYVPKSIHIEERSEKKSFLSKKILLFWGITLFIILIPILLFDTKYGGFEKGIYILARSFLILFMWYLIVGPLLVKGLNKILTKSKSRYQSDIRNTLDLFPYLRDLIRQAWQDSKPHKGRNRMQHFLAKSIVYSIHFNIPKK